MKIRKALFLSGLVSAIVYTGHVVLGGILWPGYNHLQQPISDLTAAGAPNRKLLEIFTTVYGILALVFAALFTILESRKHRKIVLWGGSCFMLLHIVSLSYGFFPEDLPGTAPTLPGTMHIVVTALIVPFTIASPFLIGLGLSSESNWRTTGKMSIVAGVLILIFGGASAFMFLNKLPYFGLVERFNIGTLQAWTFYFSYQLSIRS